MCITLLSVAPDDHELYQKPKTLTARSHNQLAAFACLAHIFIDFGGIFDNDNGHRHHNRRSSAPCYSPAIRPAILPVIRPEIVFFGPFVGAIPLLAVPSVSFAVVIINGFVGIQCRSVIVPSLQL